MKVKIIKKVRLEFDQEEMDIITGALSYVGMNATNDSLHQGAQRLEELIHKALMNEAQQVNQY
jgi:hypothetical protein